MDRYGIIGFPLGHSFSRAFFTEKFQKEHIDAEYVNFEIPSAHLLPEIVRSNPHLRGLNVTLPYKEAVIPMLDSMSDEAREIGAVNVIQVREGRLKGFNSDIIGFMDSLRPLLKPWHQHALVLGTGGASRAIRVGLERLGLDWTYVSRTVYNPEETLFLKRGAQQGATIKNGLEMLHLQALASWEFWNER